MPASDKTAVQNAVDGLKEAIADNDVAGMTRAMDLLTQMQHKAAEALYKSAGPQGSGGSEGLSPRFIGSPNPLNRNPLNPLNHRNPWNLCRGRPTSARGAHQPATDVPHVASSPPHAAPR